VKVQINDDDTVEAARKKMEAGILMPPINALGKGSGSNRAAARRRAAARAKCSCST